MNTKRMLLLFITFTFLMPLVFVLLISNVSVFQEGILYFVAFGLEAATPTISALFVLLLFKGKKQTKDFLYSCYFKNIRPEMIVLALLLPAFIIVLSKCTALLFIKGMTFSIRLSIRKMIIVAWALVAEEIGWRGFLQEKLNRSFGNILTPVIVGMIWALWHYHFILLGTMTVPIVLFILECIAQSFGYFWITKLSKGNIIPASLWHFSGNLFFNIFAISPEYNSNSLLPYILYVIYMFVMAIGISIWGKLISKKKNIINTRYYS